MPEKYILEVGSISAYYVNDNGYIVNIIADDIYMVDGTYLDNISSMVEDSIDRLNDIICG